MRRTHREGRRGFTLIELMVAMVAGSFVVAGAYYLSNVSSRVFAEQLRRAETQMTLRSATEQLRRDIGRAGYLSVRDTHELRSCDTSALLGTVGAGNGDVAPRHVHAAQVGVDALGSQLTLSGNLTTSEHYFVPVTATDPMVLPLQDTNEGYRRSFFDPQTNTFLPNRFLEAFQPDPGNPAQLGRMVSIADLDTTRIFLRDIAAVDMASVPPSIQLASPVPTTTGTQRCMSFSTMVVAPVSMFRYAIELPGAGLARVGGRTYMTGGAASNAALHPVLVRREIDMRDNSFIPGTERVVLDSIAPQGFRVEAIWDTDITDVVNLAHTANPELLADPGSIRSLIIELIVESAERRDEGDPVAQSNAAAARRSLRFEVSLPNAARNSGVF